MTPLNNTHVVLRRWRGGVRGRMDPRVDIGAGAPACPRRQACLCPSHSGVLLHAFCQACVELCLLGREGSMLGRLIVSSITPWRSSFPFSFFLCKKASLVIGCAVDPKLSCGVLFLSFLFCFVFLFGGEKAYMSIDANHTSNPKDR